MLQQNPGSWLWRATVFVLHFVHSACQMSQLLKTFIRMALDWWLWLGISAPSPHPEHHSRWTSKVGQSILPWEIPRQLLAMGILLPTMKVSFGHSGSKHVQNRLGSSGQTIYMLCLYTRWYLGLPNWWRNVDDWTGSLNICPSCAYTSRHLYIVYIPYTMYQCKILILQICFCGGVMTMTMMMRMRITVMIGVQDGAW